MNKKLIIRFSSQFEQFLEHSTLVPQGDWENNHGIVFYFYFTENIKRKLYDFGFSLLLRTNETNDCNQEIKLNCIKPA